MAELKARLIEGSRHSAQDVVETQFTYEGTAHSCVHTVNVVSGPTVTHGGGAPADTRLHYHAVERDADGDGVIDYTTTELVIVQSAKGTSVIKIIADILLKADYDAYITAFNTWSDTYKVNPTDDGQFDLVAGAPAAPTYPTATTYESGEITIEWLDDSFV